MMTARKRTQKNTAESDADRGRDMSGLDDVAAMEAELASIHERENAIREHAKRMLDDARKAVEESMDEYNKLMTVSGTGGGLLSIHEDQGGNGHSGAKTARGGEAGTDANADTGKREKPAETPSRASEGHERASVKTQAGSDDGGPLDPDAVSFADKDGVVVDDPTTSDGTDAAADEGTDGGTDDEDDGEATRKEFDFLGE